jgi:hypothetical protein
MAKTNAKKRGFSREFPSPDKRIRYDLDRIPPALYHKVHAKATKEGISLRALTLTLWRAWANAGEYPDTDN